VTAVKSVQGLVTSVTQDRLPGIAGQRRRKASHFGDDGDVPVWIQFLGVRKYVDVIPEHPYLIIPTHTPILESLKLTVFTASQKLG
jgi:hypothetical protein